MTGWCNVKNNKFSSIVAHKTRLRLPERMIVFNIWTSVDFDICLNNFCSTLYPSRDTDNCFYLKRQTVTFFLAVFLSGIPGKSEQR